jgi:hypothetical protein
MTHATDIQNPGHWGRGRALHVIDLENLVGGAISRRRAGEAWTTYERGIGIQNGDRAIVVVSKLYAGAVRSVVPAYVRLRFCAVGPNAADLLLKRNAEAEMDRTTFDIVIIASGDHTFASTAELARSRNMQVWLVTGRGGVARKLAASCPLRSKLRIATGGRPAALQPA